MGSQQCCNDVDGHGAGDGDDDRACFNAHDDEACCFNNSDDASKATMTRSAAMAAARCCKACFDGHGYEA